MLLSLERIATIPTGGPGVLGAAFHGKDVLIVTHCQGVDAWRFAGGVVKRIDSFYRRLTGRGVVVHGDEVLFPISGAIGRLLLDERGFRDFERRRIPIGRCRSVFILRKHPTQDIMGAGLADGRVCIISGGKALHKDFRKEFPIAALDFYDRWAVVLRLQYVADAWDLSTGGLVFKYYNSLKSCPTAMRFHASGYLAMGHATGTVRIFCPPDQQCRRKWIETPHLDIHLPKHGPYTIRSLAWEGDRLWAGTESGLLLWGEPFRAPGWCGTFAPHQQSIDVLEVSEDRLVTGGMDGFAYVFQIQEADPTENDHQTSALASNPAEMP